MTSTLVPVPKTEPTQFPVSVQLPLSEYGLSPGDVVKLFARVADNDPAGPKGSESPVVTVKIISEEQMQQMLLAREARGDGKYKRNFEQISLASLAPEHQATDPGILAAFKRWQDPAWKAQTVSLR